MAMILTHKVVAALALAVVAVDVARADFIGQPILGPITNGSLVTGNTFGKADDNDGFTSGDHIFDIWDGGDDVWQLNWAGGDMMINLTSQGGSDNDLFLYTPSDLNDSGIYSIVGAFDTVSLAGAAAGTYYVVVDSTAFSEGPYELQVVPTPSVGALAGIGGLMIARRRRR